VYALGDINGDGYSDIGFNAYDDVKIFFGRENPGGGVFSVESDSADIDLLIDGESFISRLSLATAGDFNGDGIDDFMLGSESYSEEGQFPTGGVFVIYGSRKFEPVMLLRSLGRTDAKIFLGAAGTGQNDFSHSLSAVGDIDADGFDDIVFNNSTTGQNYLAYGSEASADYKYSLDGSLIPNVTHIRETDTSSFYGQHLVFGGGDFNGDGFPDFGLMHEFTSETIHVIFGSSDRLPSVLDLLADEYTTGFTISIDRPGVRNAGIDLSSDVNGDGLADLIIGLQSAYYLSGIVNVVFGTFEPENRQFGDTSDNASRLITGSSEAEEWGGDIRSIGDVNIDGIDDFTIGSAEFFSPAERMTTIIFGIVN
jgi:hypothetical protein